MILEKKDGENVAHVFESKINTEPPTLHPGLATDSTSGTVLRQVLEGLSRINLEGKAELAAAEDVKISDDLKTYTFTITRCKMVKW